MTLRPALSASPAAWATAPVRDWRWVTYGPAGFEAYVRVRRSEDEDRMFAALRDVLARHTSTPETIWVGRWDGFAGDYHAPRFTFPASGSDRVYFLFADHLDEIDDPPPVREVGRPYREAFAPAIPETFWPDDRAWFVAADVDADDGDDEQWWIGVAGTSALAEALLADPRLETVAVDPYADGTTPVR